jgi:hypothetical protein
MFLAVVRIVSGSNVDHPPDRRDPIGGTLERGMRGDAGERKSERTCVSQYHDPSNPGFLSFLACILATRAASFFVAAIESRSI